MKNYVYSLFTLLLICCPFWSKAQFLVQEEVQWNIIHTPWTWGGPNYSTFSVKFEGDTLIDNQLYKKIYESYDPMNLIWDDQDKYIREDSTGKVFLKEGTDTENLLYDFNLEVGDTFDISYILPEGEECMGTVVEIDTITLFNGEEKKRLRLNGSQTTPDDIYWIEGMGSNYGVLRHRSVHAYCLFHHDYFLLCYYEQGDIVYANENFSLCWIVGTQEVQEDERLTIAPNPFGSTVNIRLEAADLTMEHLKMYSATGQLLYESQVNAQHFTFSTSSYPPGIYYVLIRLDNGQLSSRKIMKME